MLRAYGDERGAVVVERLTAELEAAVGAAHTPQGRPAPASASPDRMLTVAQAAERLGVAPTWTAWVVRCWAKAPKSALADDAGACVAAEVLGIDVRSVYRGLAESCPHEIDPEERREIERLLQKPLTGLTPEDVRKILGAAGREWAGGFDATLTESR
jgi:hypothetical protein